MKTILVLTDFSKNASRAAQSAARLAEQMHARLLLWNCYRKIPVFPGYLGGAIIAQALKGGIESREKLGQLARELEDYISATDGAYRPGIDIRFMEGAVGPSLRAELAENHFEMIVMGAASDCPVDHVFTGSDTHLVIENANCPVLIVPPRAHLEELVKVVFATDFEPKDLIAILYLEKLGIEHDFSIEVIHITINGEKDSPTIAREKLFISQLETLKSERILYREIRGKEVVNRLNRTSKQTGADIIAMTHHQYSFFRRTLSDSIAKKELSLQRTPLLIFPFAIKS